MSRSPMLDGPCAAQRNATQRKELVDRGLVNDVVMMANQVDGRDPNPKDQVTFHIMEVAMVAQAYDANFAKIDGEYIKNGINYDHQNDDMSDPAADVDNTMPWQGRSLRIYFMNANRGAGCLMHSLGHEQEYRYNESRIHAPGKAYDGNSPFPGIQPAFRRFAGFDLTTRLPAQGVQSFCESFAKVGETAAPVSKWSWDYVTSDTTIDKDCGGDFLVYWYQNMPGYQNESKNADGSPMRNWWPLFYF